MNKLYAVSALSPTAAWAVGVSNKDINASQSLIEQWDGTTWHFVASAGGDALNGVVALSPRDVWAVGGKLYPEPGYHPNNPLIMHWDGTQWSVVPSPSTGYTTELDGVAVLAANDVWAVGAFNKGTLDHPDPYPLIERWDGTAWHIVSNPTTSGGQLRAIATIPGTKQLWAVGYTANSKGSSYGQPLVERWDGSAWKVVTSPLVPLGATGVQLQSVTALSAMDAWAVGTANGSASTNYLAHWDGANWQSPYIPSATVSLASVAAAGPHDVRAVGWIAVHGYYDAIEHVLIEQWDGASWHFVTSPDPGAGSSSQLTGIATDGAGHFWAVGWYSGSPGAQTLIEHYP